MGLSPARPAAPALSDCDLVDAIRAGDQTAFTELYERYFERVYNFAYARLRHRADAEEDSERRQGERPVSADQRLEVDGAATGA